MRSTNGINRDLEYLSKSLALAHGTLWDTLADNTLYNPISNIIFRKASKGVINYYAICYEKLLDEAELIGIELDTLMNSFIRTEFSITDTSNLVRLILANNQHNGAAHTFHIVIPYLDDLANVVPDPILETITLNENKFKLPNSKKLFWSYIYGEGEYPIAGFHVDNFTDLVEVTDITPIGLNRPVAISVFGMLDDDLYIDEEDKIIDCTIDEIFCKECPSTATDLPLINTPGSGGAMDHEIKITLQGGSSKSNCFTYYIDGGGMYAVLRALPDYNYYYITPTIGDRVAYILNKPLFSSITGKYGRYLTLCYIENFFKVYGEEPDYAQYAIAQGGVYMLSIPGTITDPVFFAFPFGQEFWFQNGPDMEIHYYLNWDGLTYCDPLEEILDVTKEYFSSKNEFYTNNFVDPLNNRFIASTNQIEIESFWSDNAVHIGISTGGSAMVLEQNHHIFEAEMDPTIPEIPSDLGALIVELTTNTSALLADGTPTISFEIEKIFFDSATLPENTECILHVVAEFENGEEINEYRYITLFDNTLLYSDFRTFFRGKIINFNASLYEKE